MERRTLLKLGLAGISLALANKAWALKLYPKPSEGLNLHAVFVR